MAYHLTLSAFADPIHERASDTQTKAPLKRIIVASLAEVAKACMDYTREYDLQSSQWPQPLVCDEKGRKVGLVEFSGRICSFQSPEKVIYAPGEREVEARRRSAEDDGAPYLLIDFPIIYPVVALPKGARTRTEAIQVREVTPIQIARVTRKEARIVLTARSKDTEYEYVKIEDQFYRKAEGGNEDDAALIVDSAFLISLNTSAKKSYDDIHMDTYSSKFKSPLNWNAIIDISGDMSRFSKFVTSGRDEEIRRVNAVAAEAIIVDGAVYMKCQEPIFNLKSRYRGSDEYELFVGSEDELKNKGLHSLEFEGFYYFKDKHNEVIARHSEYGEPAQFDFDVTYLDETEFQYDGLKQKIISTIKKVPDHFDKLSTRGDYETILRYAEFKRIHDELELMDHAPDRDKMEEILSATEQLYAAHQRIEDRYVAYMGSLETVNSDLKTWIARYDADYNVLLSV